MLNKKIILCADDYSLTPGISNAILTLLRNKRLSATSCLVNTYHWSTHAKMLKPFAKKVDIGLHFALTDLPSATGLPTYKLIHLMQISHLRMIRQADIENELEQQIERFQKALGQLPDFIDGHQHIHQLPVIRQALVSIYEKRLNNHRCYIRVPLSKSYTFKSLVLRSTGASALKKQLIKHYIPHNSYFSGIYYFLSRKEYASHFSRFLRKIETGDIIMCHPSTGENHLSDPIVAARKKEFLYLNSTAFLKDCQKFKVSFERYASTH